MKKIDPKNLSAQLAYQGRGNPISTHPASAVSNSFPGLEFDFRNVWRRIFVGLKLHEAQPLVVKVDDNAPQEIRTLLNHFLISVDGEQVWAPASGPRIPNGPIESFRRTNLEWANALARVARKGRTQVEAVFFDLQAEQTVSAVLEVRDLFDRGGQNDVLTEQAVLSRDIAQPGELTQSLCSPWQNDYLECACYYWAASRPDFVNTETEEDGTTTGQNWLHKDRDENTPREYSLRRTDLVSYSDLFRNWEKELRFIIGGKDAD